MQFLQFGVSSDNNHFRFGRLTGFEIMQFLVISKLWYDHYDCAQKLFINEHCSTVVQACTLMCTVFQEHDCVTTCVLATYLLTTLAVDDKYRSIKAARFVTYQNSLLFHANSAHVLIFAVRENTNFVHQCPGRKWVEGERGWVGLRWQGGGAEITLQHFGICRLTSFRPAVYDYLHHNAAALILNCFRREDCKKASNRPRGASVSMFQLISQSGKERKGADKLTRLQAWSKEHRQLCTWSWVGGSSPSSFVPKELHWWWLTWDPGIHRHMSGTWCFPSSCNLEPGLSWDGSLACKGLVNFGYPMRLWMVVPKYWSQQILVGKTINTARPGLREEMWVDFGFNAAWFVHIRTIAV